MIRRIILLLILILNFVFIQNTVFAQDKNMRELYLDGLQKKIESNWFIPLGSTLESASVSFVVNKDGKISDVEVIKGSGNNKFDESVIEAIYKTGSFLPLSKNENAISVQFFFSPTYTSLTINDNQNYIADQLFKNNGKKIIPVSNLNYSDFNDYTAYLQDKVNSNWNPVSRKEQADAIISVRIDKDGTIDGTKVQKSSGKKNFDLETLDSVMRSVPLNPLPAALQSGYKDIQISFMYKKTKDKNPPQKYVTATLNNQDGYDDYVNQVEEIISRRLKDKYYFFKKDIVLEIKINKDGKLKYAKVQKDLSKDNFIKKEFNRKVLLTLYKTSFPPIPDKMNVNNITLNYRILTQRKRLFSNFICDYVWNFFRTGLESFCVQPIENI